MNKPNMHNDNTGISSFQASLNDLFKREVIESSHKGKKYFFWFLILGYFFSKCTFLKL